MRSKLAGQIHAAETQQQQLSSVVDNLREGVIALDKTGHIVLVNRSAIDLLSLGSEDLTGSEFKSAIAAGGILDLYHELMSAGQCVDGQAHAPDDSGRMLEVHAARVASGAPGGIAVLLVLRDVTEIARAAAMKAEFVANASHELRTPLATIRAAAETLGDETSGDPQAVAKVAAILNRHITRLEQMTNDLLNLNLVEMPGAGPNLTDIPSAALVERIREEHADQAASKQIELLVSTAPEDHTFASDPTLLQLIVDNLLSNALKFTPTGGKVTCTLTGDSNSMTLTVTDTGCGIPAEIQDRVFERFFQAATSRSGDASVRGTGLGLAIVKHATDRLGGRVALSSGDGEGTTVTVTLPLARRTA
jgi:PAS domain S-box-containing protein